MYIAQHNTRACMYMYAHAQRQKFLVDEHGEQGAGKDQAKAQAAIERKEELGRDDGRGDNPTVRLAMGHACASNTRPHVAERNGVIEVLF